MLIPAAMIELNETDIAFGQPPRQQAIGGIASGAARVRAVHLKGRIRLFG
jgi:hypothetical protein